MGDPGTVAANCADQALSRSVLRLARVQKTPDSRNKTYYEIKKKSMFCSPQGAQPWQAGRVRRLWSANGCQGCVLDERAGMMAKALVWRPAHLGRTQNTKERITNRRRKDQFAINPLITTEDEQGPARPLESGKGDEEMRTGGKEKREVSKNRRERINRPRTK